MKKLRTLLLVASLMACSGCATTGAGTNAHWYNPTTWFSGSAGRAAAKTEQKLGTAEDQAVDEAKTFTHETQEALHDAPPSRQVDAAKVSNDNAVALLDQVAGPLTAKQAAGVKEKVRLLTSDLADERAKGEKLRDADQKRADKLSDRIDALIAVKAVNDDKLAAAFVRENGLANELRDEKWWSWFWRISIGLVAVAGVAGYAYLRLTLGGLPTALTKSLGKFTAADPAAAAKFTDFLNIHTTPAEQTLIRTLAARHV